MARHDILRAISALASCVTKWTSPNDRDLYHLICYIRTTVDFTSVSWVGDDAAALRLRLFADADYNNCPRTIKSTSGVVLFAHAQYTKFLLGAISKKQTAVAASTAEAEMVAASVALRTMGIPHMTLFERVLNRPVHLDFCVCVHKAADPLGLEPTRGVHHLLLIEEDPHCDPSAGFLR